PWYWRLSCWRAWRWFWVFCFQTSSMSSSIRGSAMSRDPSGKGFMSFFDPMTRKRIQKFTRIKRAYYSFWILCITYGLSLGAEFIAHDQPLVVYYQGSFYFPVFKVYKGTDFGLNSPVEPDYRAISPLIKEKG